VIARGLIVGGVIHLGRLLSSQSNNTANSFGLTDRPGRSV
jgi:hypothetical protein